MLEWKPLAQGLGTLIGLAALVGLAAADGANIAPLPDAATEVGMAPAAAIRSEPPAVSPPATEAGENGSTDEPFEPGVSTPLPGDAADRGIQRDWSMRFLPHFVLSGWYGPALTPDFAVQLQELRRGGFNVLFPPGGAGSDRAANLRALAAARTAGLPLFIADSRLPTRLGNDPEGLSRLDAVARDYRGMPDFAGYFLDVRPQSRDCSALGQVTAALRSRDNSHPIIVRVPSAGELPGSQSYEDYIRQFVRNLRPVLLVCHQSGGPAGDSHASFFHTLDAVHAAARHAGIPFWATVPLTTQTTLGTAEGEIRGAAFQSLAYGAQGLLFWPLGPENPGESKGTTPVSALDAEGKPTPLYPVMQTLAIEILPYGRLLSELQPYRVYHMGEAPESIAAIPRDAPLFPDHGEFTVGEFRDRRGQRSVLIASGDYHEARMISLRVAPGVNRVDQYDPLNGRWTSLQVPADHRYLSISFAPGGASLFRLR